jgi:hypothetical protein
MTSTLKLLGGLAASTVLFAACAQPQAPAAPPPGACNAEAARFAIGQPATAQLAEQARQRAGATRVRLIRPGQMVTMEFDGSRLNLDVDAAEKVAGVRCG